MKRRGLAVLLSALLVVSTFVGCGNTSETNTGAETETTEVQETEKEVQEQEVTESEETAGGLKIGITVQSLSNQLWAVACSTMKELAEAEGNELTYMACDDSSGEQITQIENFINSGVDVIMVHPSDANAIESVCAQAQEAGIKVMCWDNEMTNTDLNWVIDNEALGTMIGEQAAEFINANFENGACEVAVLNYPQTEILLQRENGIIAALEEHAPNATVVAQQPALDAAAGITAMETILNANPDVKVVCCIGGGGAVGANEAFKAALGDIPTDVGVFAADATEEELAAMVNGEANRMSVMVTGVPVTLGEVVYNMLEILGTTGEFTEADLSEGETINGKNVYRSIFPVTVDNVSEYYSE